MRLRRLGTLFRGLTTTSTPPLPTVLLVGRPNVGKSTLFNRLAETSGARRRGRRRGRRSRTTTSSSAIVSPVSGTTRDVLTSPASIGASLSFLASDSAGVEASGGSAASFPPALASAVSSASAILLLLDAREGLVPFDISLSKSLRRHLTTSSAIVLPVLNKTEGLSAEALDDLAERVERRLGFGLPLAISAAHGEGMAEIYAALESRVTMPRDEREKKGGGKEEEEKGGGEVTATEEEDTSERPLIVAILGRPNAGKSTLFNRLLDDPERASVSPRSGTTRDPIRAALRGGNSATATVTQIVDTAGVRKRRKSRDPSGGLEDLAVTRAMDAMASSDVTILALDATEGVVSRGDRALASSILDEGRGLVVALTKCDLLEEGGGSETAVRGVTETLRRDISYAQAGDVEVVATSGVTGAGVRDDALMRAVKRVRDRQSRYVSTGTLNRWLARFVALRPPPGGVALKYATQVSSRPPTFCVWRRGGKGSRRRKPLPEAYVRGLIAGLRDEFDMHSVAVRVMERERE